MQASDFLEMAGIYLTVFAPFWVTLLLWLRWRRWLGSHLRFTTFSTLSQVLLLLVAILCVQQLMEFALAHLSSAGRKCEPRAVCEAFGLLALYRAFVWMGGYALLVALFDLYLKRRRPAWFGFAAVRGRRRWR